MAKIYTPNTWIDETLADDPRFNILEDGGTAFKADMRIEQSTDVVQAGTAVEADLMNNIEDGLDALDTIVADRILSITTGGTSTAYTLTTIGASALTNFERFRVKFNATAGATPTLNRDGKGAKSLKYYDSTGAKVACGATSIIANMISDVEYDGTDYVVIDRLAGVRATSAEINTGTDTEKIISPDALAGSNLAVKLVSFCLNGTIVLTTSDKAYWRVPAEYTGMNLVSAKGSNGTGAAGSSSSGNPTFTVKNVTDNQQMLSTSLTIDSGEYTSASAATPAVIDTAHDDVATDDLIEIAVTTSGTGTTYATVTLGFQLP
jgi:hypothetical protein